MSFKATTGGVIVYETCSCGARIDIASATGWLDSANVKEQLREWRIHHQHPLTEWPPEAIEAAARAVWERNNDGNWFQHKQLRTGSYLEAKHDAEAALAAAWGHITGDNK